MPRSPSVSVAFHPKQQSEGEASTPQSPPDSGVEDFYKRPQLLEPQSPASPRASRSFFGGIRSGNKNKNKTADAAGLSAPSTPNISLNTPASYRLNVDQSSADLLQGNGVDALSLSEGSAPEGLAVSDTVSPETELAPTDIQGQRRPSKHVFGNILGRSRSVARTDLSPKPASKTAAKGRFLEPISREEDPRTSPRAKPIDTEKVLPSAMRGKSSDRAGSSKENKASSWNENTNMMSSIKTTGSQAAGGISRASRGLFSKFTSRQPSSDEKQEEYKLKVIELPVMEQARQTRICKRITDAKDKTEYWMPALPYRCIDYLNLKGIEEEGLYRVPGGTREIKYWQERFDRELDINLLDEEELYDINTVGSMLKAWLRTQGDGLFPKSTQRLIAQANPKATSTPQMLRDELSKLPPYNYYTLFAITCHIALLHSHSDKNKMTYHNLMVCFQPSLGVEPFCFQFLVCEWRTCWQGCWSEKDYLAEEKALLSAAPEFPPTSSGGQSMATTVASSSRGDVDAVSMTSNSRPATGGQGSSARKRPSPVVVPEDQEATVSNLGGYSRPAIGSSPSTPPSLSPVGQVSPIRL